MKLKLFEVSLAELPRGETLSAYAESQVNDFLTKNPNIEIVHTHLSNVVIPAEEGGGVFRESPAAIVVMIGIFYRER